MNNFSFWEMIGSFLYILGGLGIFLYGMKGMSSAIQKLAGDGMRNIMANVTRNRCFALLTGLSVTCLVQSSSATTVMVVSFVNAQLLTLTESIGVIMGANLGTTLTGWIIASVGKFSLSKIALPLIGIGFPFIFLKREKLNHFGEFLIGFGLLFFGLSELKNAVPDVKSLLQSADPADQLLVENVKSVIEQLNSYGFFSILIFVVIGVILTIMVQSSSAAMGITIILSANGWINFEIAAAIVLGENIGTTITAWLASIGTSITAKRAARAHFIFNITGVLWMLILFYPFTSLVNELMPGAIYTSEISDIDAKDYLTKKGLTSESFTDEEIVAAKKSIVDSNIPLHLSMFHTLFNLCNICLLIWFSPNIARLAERLVREKT